MSSFKTINRQQARFIEAAKAEREQPLEMIQLPAGAKAASGSSVRRAVITTVNAANFTCRLLDVNDLPSEVITVYPVEHLGSNNLTGNVWPKYANGDNLACFLDINGKWYSQHPFDDTEECIST